MLTPTISIIVPTWNNPQFLNPCIDSIRATGVLDGLAELIIVNNGKQPIKDYVKHFANTTVLEPGENLGWEKGLALGVAHAKGQFFCFQNDDTHIPIANHDFYKQLLYPMANADVAAVGPSTTVAAGWHSIYQRYPVRQKIEVSYLIFFTVMVRRSAYEEVGGIDISCPGGDDLDLSMRLRAAGHHLVINPSAFIIHHAFKTGERVKGDPSQPDGWNSLTMRDRTNHYLISKHGFENFINTSIGLSYNADTAIPVDTEGNCIRAVVGSEGSIVELGCGYRKTIENSIGIDRVEKGLAIPHVPGGVSQADIVADVSEPLPVDSQSKDVVIARHILEHCIDPIETIRNWADILKIGGKMIIAVPNQEICSSIPLNPEHVHAFTPQSLTSLMEVSGFTNPSIIDPKNGISFIGVYEKLTHIPNSKNLIEVAHA
jgi:SAM-dependent methyltransferase